VPHALVAESLPVLRGDKFDLVKVKIRILLSKVIFELEN